jgi:hypothetical protein
MALINCYECGKEVSDTAVRCPYCGKLDPNSSPAALRGLVAVAFLAWWVLPLGAVIGMLIADTPGFLIGALLAIVALVVYVKGFPKKKKS